jgi:hypothetical protein
MDDEFVPEAAILRSREIEIDVLVGHELASRSPAAQLLWTRVGEETPAEYPVVERQTTRWDGRTTDVEAKVTDGRRLLLEDKASGGHFEFEQVDSYVIELQRVAGTYTCLVAPRAYIEVNQVDAERFSAAVSVEELADALDPPGVPSREPTTELEASYRYERSCCAAVPAQVSMPGILTRKFGTSGMPTEHWRRM